MNNELIWAAVRVFVALPIVLILAYLLIKYGLSRRYSFISGSNRMKLVEQLSLSPKATLSLVELGDKHYLLAHQDNTVQLIKELDRLPAPEKAVSGNITELIPRSVADLGQNADRTVRDSIAAQDKRRAAAPGFRLRSYSEAVGQGFQSLPELIRHRGVFAGLPQKGRAVYAAGRDYFERMRSQVNIKEKSKQE